MRFTSKQYFEAIKALNAAMTQLEPDGRDCAICGDGGHQAFECGQNPLVAMLICERVAKQSEELHESLHYLAGYYTSMGHTVGPGVVVLPAHDVGEART